LGDGIYDCLAYHWSGVVGDAAAAAAFGCVDCAASTVGGVGTVVSIVIVVVGSGGYTSCIPTNKTSIVATTHQ